MAAVAEKRVGRNGRNVCVAVSRISVEVVDDYLYLGFALSGLRFAHCATSILDGRGGYWILSAAVSLLPEAAPWRACASRPDPAANSSPAYLWLHRFLHTIAGNITTALGSKIPGVNAAINGVTTTLLLLFPVSFMAEATK